MLNTIGRLSPERISPQPKFSGISSGPYGLIVGSMGYRDAFYALMERRQDDLAQLWPTLDEMDQYRIAEEVKDRTDRDALMAKIPGLEAKVVEFAKDALTGEERNPLVERFPNRPRVVSSSITMSGPNDEVLFSLSRDEQGETTVTTSPGVRIELADRGDAAPIVAGMPLLEGKDLDASAAEMLSEPVYPRFLPQALYPVYDKIMGRS